MLFHLVEFHAEIDGQAVHRLEQCAARALDGSLDALREQTKGETLEDVFRQLTHTDDTEPAIGRALEAMKL